MHEDPEVAASNYSWLIPLGMLGMFVAHFLAFIGFQVAGSINIGLPYWWAYPVVFPAIAAMWILWKGTAWVLTATLLLIPAALYFTWVAFTAKSDSLDNHPFTAVAATLLVTLLVSFGAERQRRAERGRTNL